MSDYKVILKDDDGNDCLVENILDFQKHIITHHSSGISIHEENGHYFRVDDAFRNKILNIIKEIQE